MILLTQKWQYEEERATFSLRLKKTKTKNYFLIPSDASENEQQTNQKPKAFFSTPNDFFQVSEMT